jgi:hypothetical protein
VTRSDIFHWLLPSRGIFPAFSPLFRTEPGRAVRLMLGNLSTLGLVRPGAIGFSPVLCPENHAPRLFPQGLRRRWIPRKHFGSYTAWPGAERRRLAAAATRSAMAVWPLQASGSARRRKRKRCRPGAAPHPRRSQRRVSLSISERYTRKLSGRRHAIRDRRTAGPEMPYVSVLSARGTLPAPTARSRGLLHQAPVRPGVQCRGVYTTRAFRRIRSRFSVDPPAGFR